MTYEFTHQICPAFLHHQLKHGLQRLREEGRRGEERERKQGRKETMREEERREGQDRRKEDKMGGDEEGREKAEMQGGFVGRGGVPTNSNVHLSQLRDFKTWDWPGNEANAYIGQSTELIVKIFALWFRT